MAAKIRGWLLVAVLLAAATRLVGLSKLPPGFTPDEAAFGYNAYSLLQTGADEWGTPWYLLPVTNLRSFGDYKLPLYAFLTIPSVKFFGLTEFAVRLPNAILGVLSIVVIYFLVLELFSSSALAGVCALLLAVSPWHISLSRGGFEANLATFFLPLGIYFFLKKRWLISAVTLTLSFYAYHSSRLVLPFVVLALVIFFRPKLSEFLKFALPLFILIIPGSLSLLGLGSARISDVSILSPTDNWAAVADRRFTARNAGLPDTFARIFSNKVTGITSEFSTRFLSYLSPQFLFTSGAAEGTYGMLPGRGVMYYADLAALVALLIYFVRHPNRKLFFLLSLLLIFAVPGSLAKGPGYAANRVAPMVIPLVIFSGIGLRSLYTKFKPFLIPAASLAYAVFFAFFLEAYVYHAPSLIGRSMLFGWGQAMSRILSLAPNYEIVKFDRALSEPHIYVAFYGKIPPKDYQIASRSWPDFSKLGFKFLDQYDGYTLGKYVFGNFHPQEQVQVPTLFVGKPENYPANYPEHFTIYAPDGNPVIKVADAKP